MKNIFITLITLCIFSQIYSQTTGKQTIHYLVKVWGEVSDNVPEHRGKSGLVLLKLNQNKTFSAYENTDYGASILQVGNWTIKQRSITFIVTKTVLARKEKEYFMNGSILNAETGKITYDILELANNKLIIKSQISNKTLIFKPTNFVYFPN